MRNLPARIPAAAPTSTAITGEISSSMTRQNPVRKSITANGVRTPFRTSRTTADRIRAHMAARIPRNACVTAGAAHIV